MKFLYCPGTKVLSHEKGPALSLISDECSGSVIPQFLQNISCFARDVLLFFIDDDPTQREPISELVRVWLSIWVSGSRVVDVETKDLGHKERLSSKLVAHPTIRVRSMPPDYGGPKPTGWGTMIALLAFAAAVAWFAWDWL
jgi:hypothetical protein